jgi:hypothetical protein
MLKTAIKFSNGNSMPIVGLGTAESKDPENIVKLLRAALGKLSKYNILFARCWLQAHRYC